MVKARNPKLEIRNKFKDKKEEMRKTNSKNRRFLDS